ncbi:MAG: PH domain-containing protein [Xanthomonadaceae bacterium]|jgi:membrane protein YdbS with pleckstrin-like domain|nr:PH domain-containing protein [Xanthomonadaceae bacterium]
MTDVPPLIPSSSRDSTSSTTDYRDWQPLPIRGAWLLTVTHAAGILFAAGILVAALLLSAFDDKTLIVSILLGPLAVIGILSGWIGWRRHRRISWKLDEAGFAVRSGHWWRVDSRIPISRVQHLDVKRGPLERHWRLATLVIYTAGTQLASVSVPLLDAADAEKLRDRLSRQLDLGDGL